MNKLLVEVHRWAGFIIGIAFVFIMVTGVVLAIWEQLQVRTYTSEAFVERAPAEIGRDLDQLIGTGQEGLLGTLFLPNAATPVYEVTVFNDTGVRGTVKHFYDQSLNLVGQTHSGQRHPILDALIDWHVSLVDGQRFTPYIGLAATVIALIALYIWWPFRRGFDWKIVAWPKDFKASNLLMNHTTGGMVSVAFLLLFSITGAFIGLRTVVGDIAATMETEEQIQALEVPQVTKQDMPWQSWEVLVANAYAAMPEGAELATVAAERVSAVIDFRFRGNDDISLFGQSHLYMNPYTAQAEHRYITSESSGLRWFLGQSRSLHTGEAMSTPFLIMLIVGGTLVSVIAFTGIVAFVRRLTRNAMVKQEKSLVLTKTAA